MDLKKNIIFKNNKGKSGIDRRIKNINHKTCSSTDLTVMLYKYLSVKHLNYKTPIHNYFIFNTSINITVFIIYSL